MKSGFIEILSALHDHHVDFVIVGGVAAAIHGGPRVTFDLDLVHRGSETFDKLRQRAVKVTIDQRTFLVASIDDLISMKQRAGRPGDLLDIAELRNIQKRLD
ncbi:MAG: hypothetical protein OXF27_13220 [Acidobacteria bacterium]|nr:hypothetical protein [Acidobacteriota bacterium]